jgi:beta-glucosidase
VSDWGAVQDRVAALAAGLDLEMPPNLGVSDGKIVAAVRAGELDESIVDDAVTRVLMLVERALPGLETDDRFDAAAHHALARSAAGDCAVLLKNDGEVLPLEPAAGATVAIIGEFARTPRYQGAGSSQVNPTRVDVALDEIRSAVPAGVRVPFAAGFGMESTVDGSRADDAALRAEAVELAAGADSVVVFLGLPPSAESEGFDREHLELPANQVALLEAVATVHDRIVVVLANGGAVRVAGWEHHASAVLECWLSGQAAGGAVADLLLGVTNPSGRLAETLPLRLEDNSSYLNFPGDSGHVRYGEGVFVGYRGHDAAHQEVSYPFGHGLSYTTFEYTGLGVTVEGSHEAGDLRATLTCTVANTGARAGREVVQLYVRDVAASVARPVRELKAFAKVALDPGETTTVTFVLGSRDLSYWSARAHDWVLEGGEFEFSVGESSRDLRLTIGVDIPAPPVGEPLGADSTLEEWLADPVGSVALRAAFGTDEDGNAKGLLGDEELLRVIGNFPMSRLAAFPDVGLDRAALDTLLHQVR